MAIESGVADSYAGEIPQRTIVKCLAENIVQLSVLLSRTSGIGPVILAFYQRTALSTKPEATIWICGF